MGATLYPAIEPYVHGHLEAGDGHSSYWEQCGDPAGKAALVLHGGPGSGCDPWFRELFDPRRYRVVLHDQRNSGRSTPHAAEPDVDLTTNTTPHLVADIERLRVHLGIDRWLLLGGSWGTSLALAYAEAFPEHVSEMVLFGVTAGLHREFDHVFRGGLADDYPVQWQALRDAVLPDNDQDGDVLAATHRLLFDDDPVVREQAARAWAWWESAIADWPATDELKARFHDRDYALAFARIVTHYALNYAWLEDGELIASTPAIADIPVALIDGEDDHQTLSASEVLSQRLPLATRVVVADASHSGSSAGIEAAIVSATDRFAAR